MKRTVAKKNRPPIENIAVEVDVRMLRDLETFLGRLADPRDTDFSSATVARHRRALAGLLAQHAIHKERELKRALRSTTVTANRLQRQVFRLEEQIWAAKKGVKAPERSAEELAPAIFTLEAVR